LDKGGKRPELPRHKRQYYQKKESQRKKNWGGDTKIFNACRREKKKELTEFGDGKKKGRVKGEGRRKRKFKSPRPKAHKTGPQEDTT